MANPSSLGSAPGVGALGYDQHNFDTVSVWPLYPYPLASSTLNSGTTGTASTGGAGTSTWQSSTTAILYAGAWNPGWDISYHNIHNYFSFSSAAGTGSHTAGMVLGIYQRSYTGTPQASTSSVWSQVTAFQKNIRVTQNSQTAVSIYSYQGTNSATSSGSTTSGSNDFIVGTRALDMHQAQTNGLSTTQLITAGDYLMLWGVTKKTSGGADVFGGIDTVYNHLSVSNSAYFSAGEWGSASTQNPFFGASGGYFSTTSQTSFSQTSASAAGQTYADGSLLPTTLVNSQVTGTASGWRSLVPFFYMTAQV